MGVKGFLKTRSGLRVNNNQVTNAASLTLRQSLWPLTIVTLLFFLWVSAAFKTSCELEYRLTMSRVSLMDCWTR